MKGKSSYGNKQASFEKFLYKMREELYRQSFVTDRWTGQKQYVSPRTSAFVPLKQTHLAYDI